jgi:hypothetical protein
VPLTQDIEDRAMKAELWEDMDQHHYKSSLSFSETTAVGSVVGMRSLFYQKCPLKNEEMEIIFKEG